MDGETAEGREVFSDIALIVIEPEELLSTLLLERMGVECKMCRVISLKVHWR